MDHTPSAAHVGLSVALLAAAALMPGSAIANVLSNGESMERWLPEPHIPTNSGLPPQANHGTAVATANGLVAVSAPGEGTVRLYSKPGATWSEQAQLIAGGPGGAGFGHAVAMDQDGATIVVGAPQSSEVYVFEQTDGAWSQAAVLTAAGASCLGRALAIDGDLLVAGAPCKADEVHVFERGGEGWASVDVVDGPGQRFGWSVAVDGDRVAAGSLGEAALLFDRAGPSWDLAATLTSPSPNPSNDEFARSLDIDGGALVVGAPAARPSPAETGAAYVFTKAEEGGANWALESTLLPSDLSPIERQSNVRFGAAVSIAEGRIAIGAPGDDLIPGSPAQPLPDQRDEGCRAVPLEPTCQYPGAVYMFGSTASGWVQEAKLNAPSALPTEPPRSMAWNGRPDAFGTAVALAGEIVAVGSPFADLLIGDEAGGANIFARHHLGVGA